MKLRIRISCLIYCLALTIIFAGCGRTTVKALPVDEPKRILNTYLEGLRDHDPAKIKQAVTYEVYSSWGNDKKKTDRMFAQQDTATGPINRWAFAADPYFDEINNQAIIRTRLNTEKAFYVIDFDLRKEDRWIIYGTKIINKSLFKKNQTPLPGSGTEKELDSLLENLNKANFHAPAK